MKLTRGEKVLLSKLNTPAKIQDYVARLKPNFEPHGDQCRSPRLVIKSQSAHCVEGALFAALALSYHGHRPLLLDLTAAPHDFDHVVAPFKIRGYWGAISKSNHAVLRYRDPVYKTLRELVLSYFHEYFDEKGMKTLISYSRVLDLHRFRHKNWATDEDSLWYIPETLIRIKHFPLVPSRRELRRADPIEIKAGGLIETKPPRSYSLQKNWFL